MEPDETNENKGDDTKNSCRQQISKFVKNKKTHAFSLCLVVIDACLVLCLLLVDLNVIPIPDDEEGHGGQKLVVEESLHFTGLGILCIFMVEIILKIIADGRDYFRQKLEVFDGLVVLVSFVLDVALTLSHVNNYVRDAVILLILLRLWRFFKLLFAINICVRKEVHGEITTEMMKRQQAEQRRERAERERDEALQKLRECQENKTNEKV